MTFEPIVLLCICILSPHTVSCPSTLKTPCISACSPDEGIPAAETLFHVIYIVLSIYPVYYCSRYARDHLDCIEMASPESTDEGAALMELAATVELSPSATTTVRGRRPRDAQGTPSGLTPEERRPRRGIGSAQTSPSSHDLARLAPASERILVRSAASSTKERLAYLRSELRKVLLEKGKARAHNTFLNEHIIRGTTPKGLVIDMPCAALRADITTIQEKWTETLTMASKTLTKLLKNHYDTLLGNIEERRTEITTEITTTLESATQQERSEHHELWTRTLRNIERIIKDIEQKQRDKLKPRRQTTTEEDQLLLSDEEGRAPLDLAPLDSASQSSSGYTFSSGQSFNGYIRPMRGREWSRRRGRRGMAGRGRGEGPREPNTFSKRALIQALTDLLD